MFAAGRLAAFAERVGLELEAGVLLHTSVIERFIIELPVGVAGDAADAADEPADAGAGDRALPEPSAVPLVRERAKRPYSRAEIDGYLRLAAAQSTRGAWAASERTGVPRAGAGLIAGELRHVCGTDVVERAGGVIVEVSGARALGAGALPLPRAAAAGRRVRRRAT